VRDLSFTLRSMRSQRAHITTRLGLFVFPCSSKDPWRLPYGEAARQLALYLSVSLLLHSTSENRESESFHVALVSQLRDAKGPVPENVHGP